MLPDELIVNIIASLNLNSFAKARLINKKFKDISDNSTLALSVIANFHESTKSIFESCLLNLNKLANPHQICKVEEFFKEFRETSNKKFLGPFLSIANNIDSIDKILNVLRSANSFMKGGNKWVAINDGNSNTSYKLLAEHKEFEGETLYLMDSQGCLNLFDTFNYLLDNKPIYLKIQRFTCKKEIQSLTVKYSQKKFEVDCLLKIIEKLPNI